MQKIDKEQYKKDVLRVLEKVGEPIWAKDLQRKHGLPDLSLFRKGKPRPTQEAIRELERDKKISILLPRYYKPDSTKPRRKIALYKGGNPRKYFEIELMNRITELEQQLNKSNINNITSYNMTKEEFNNVATELFVAINRLNTQGDCTKLLLSKHFNAPYDMFSPSHRNRPNNVLRVMLEDGVVKQSTKPLGSYGRHTAVLHTAMSGTEFDSWLASCEPPVRQIRGSAKKARRVARNTGRSKGSYLVKSILKTHNLMQKELADRIGVDQGLISRLCTGKVKVTPAIKEKLAPFVDGNITDDLDRAPTQPQPTHKLTVVDTSELLVDTIMGAIGSYISHKKKETEANIISKLNERDYYKDLSEKYAKEIEELKAKSDTKKFLGIDWN